jgi:hypothetical protein
LVVVEEEEEEEEVEVLFVFVLVRPSSLSSRVCDKVVIA